MAQRGQGWIVLALDYLPLVLFFGFFYAVPILYVLASLNLTELVGLLGDPYVLRLTGATALEALLSTIPSVVLAVPIAYFLSRYSFKWSKMLRNLLLTPFFVPALAVTEGMILMLGERGAVNQILEALLHSGTPVINILYSMDAVVVAHVFYYLPLAVMILEQGFSSVDQDLIDAAQISGAGWLKSFKAVYLNQLIPFLSASALLVFAFSFISYSTPILVGGRFSTLEVEIYSTRTRSVSSSLALIQLALTLLLSLSILALRDRLYVRGKTVERRRTSLSVSNWQGKALLGYSLAITAIELFPVYLVLAQSVSPSNVFFFPSSLSLVNFANLFSANLGFGLKFADVLLQSLAIGVVVALSSVAVSVFLIWRGSRDEGIRRITAAILSLPLSISRSSLALGIMLCYGFGLLMLYGSWTIIVIGQIAIIVPLTARVIEASWTRIGADVRQAAELFGASRIFTLLKVELPLIAPAVLASFLLAFSSSISEFTMANFFSTFNLVTLPVSVVSLIDLRRMDLAAALNGIIIVIVIAAEVMSSFLSDEALRVI